MDWDKLKIFHTVAFAESFTAAGDVLNLSQSSVSRQISALEQDLGVTLFHRHARGLILTEQGEILQKAVNDVHQKLHLVEGRLQDTRKLPEGPLVVTVSDFIGSTWLAPRIRVFKEKYPQIQLTVLFDDRTLNIGMREADVGIRLHKPKDPDLIQRQMTSIHFHLCASEEYIKTYGAPESVDDLKEHTLLAFPENTQSPIPDPNWLFDIAGVNLDTNNNLIMMNSMYAIHKAVQSGAGIAVLPDYLIYRKDNLIALLKDLKRPSVDMYFTYAEERRDSNRISVFRDFLLDTIHQTRF